MSEKRDNVIKYISALPPGTKISVRTIAKELNVSEGTAYKAIKYAEELNLVETKPRAGTYRISNDAFSEFRPVTLSSMIGRLGLIILAGPEYTDFPIGKIVVGDGCFEQFKSALLNAGQNAICIMGDRPEFLSFAVSHGISTILSGGSIPSDRTISAAAERGACILSSMQDSYTVLNLLSKSNELCNTGSTLDEASRWMRTPPYLYYNDLVFDWYSSYKDILSFNSACAVVDDDMRICGTVDASKALAAAPSLKISRLYSQDSQVYTADVSTPMPEIAQHMVSNETSIAYITRNGILCGLITANDILRYYQLSPSFTEGGISLPPMECINSDHSRCVYTIQFGDTRDCSSDVLLHIANIAAKRYCSEILEQKCSFINGTFFARPTFLPGVLMVSCEIQQANSACFTLLIEMYDESTSYAHCVLVVTAGDNIKDL